MTLPAFDASAYLASLAGARARLAEAEALGRGLAHKTRLAFIGCGASDRLMAIAHYWAERHARTLDLRRYFPAEAMAQDPPVFDADTVVLLASKSGTTAETVAAAQWLREKPCTTVCVTERADSPLAQAAGAALTFGVTDQAYYATYMMAQAFVLGLLDRREQWPLAAPLRAGLAALPDALVAAIQANEARNAEFARRYRDAANIYVTGAGTCFSTAYVFAVCVLMEMQWLHAQPIQGAEFFHGPFEIVTEGTPVIALVGEDPSRTLAERVVGFCERFKTGLMVYDSADAAMPGVPAEARGVLSPLVLQCSLTRLAAGFADLRGHPLATRRYMGKVAY
jgi:fructoselysine 6-phosphate deglycase